MSKVLDSVTLPIDNNGTVTDETYVNNPKSIAPQFDASTAYTAGQFVYYEKKLYRFIADHAAGAWNSAHVEEKTIGAEISALKADFTQVTDILSGSESVNIGYEIAGTSRYIMASTGAVSSESLANWSYTDYVDVSMYSAIEYKRSTHIIATPAVGMAFYDDTKTYISGIAGYGSRSGLGYELFTASVPNNAKYARFSVLVDAQTYGAFAVSGKSPLVSNVDVLNDAVCTEIGDWIYGKGIDLSGGVGSVVSLTPSSNTNVWYTILDCSAGDIFTVNGCGAIAYRQWGFLDSSNKIIDVDGIRSHNQNKVLIAPQGTAKLVLNQLGADYSFENCYKGTFPVSTAINDIPGKSKIVVPIYENGSIDGSGLHDANDNIRTKYAIVIQPGQRLIVTNTSKDYSFTVYRVRQNTYNILSSGWISGYGQIVVDDFASSYIIRIRKNNSATIQPNEGSVITSVIEDIQPAPINANIEANRARVGFTREYSFINPLLTYERKDMQEDGTIVSSTTRCLAKLPMTGCVEVKQQRYHGCFKIAKVRNGTVTWLVSDWSYYSYRYVGDGLSTYYLIVANSENTNSTIYTDAAENNIAVYMFVDIGRDLNRYFKLSGKKIAFIGDSITQGRFAKYGTSLNWTTAKPFGALVAEEACDDDYGNFGIGGALVYNNDWKSLYANCGKVSGYDVVFVCGGTNDYGNNVSEEDFVSAYTYVIETLLSNNTDVVVCTPVYRTSKTGANTVGLTLLDYVDLEKEIAVSHNLKVIDQYTLTNNSKFINYLPDGLHPNEIGHRLMADNIIKEYNRLA